MAVAGSRSSNTEGDLLLVDGGVRREGTEEDQRSIGQVKAVPQQRSSNTGRVDGDTRSCLSTPADNLHLKKWT